MIFTIHGFTKILDSFLKLVYHFNSFENTEKLHTTRKEVLPSYLTTNPNWSGGRIHSNGTGGE